MESFQKHDLSESRYRKDQYEVTNKTFLKDAREKLPKLNNVTDQEIRKIIEGFNKEIVNAVIDNREGVELPESLGYLMIVACQPKQINAVDYAKSKKYGVKVYHKNWDTDGRMGKIIYSNASVKYKVKDREIWGFFPSREFSRTVSKIFRNNWMNYIEIANDEWVSKLIDKQNAKQNAIKEYRKKYMEKVVKTYNEFE
jgi:hypothetical protein